MNEKLKKIKESVFDIIFPKFCLGCEREGLWVCEKCLKKIIQVKTQVCPECGKVSSLGRYCPKHKRLWGLSGIMVAGYYQEGPLKEIIHNFKYNHILELGNFLGTLMAEALEENLPAEKNLLLCAVPLHFLRRAQRGYNQAEILGSKIACELKLPANFKLLKKVRFTKPQVQVAQDERRVNLIKSFAINQNISLKGKTIILIDDVATTGTTLNECAKVLRKKGARRVWGLVAAKG